MKLYHLTPASNVESICERGLVPFENENGLSSAYILSVEPWRHQVVWLTDDVDYIIGYQADYHFRMNAVVLEIDCTGLELEHREGYYDDHEWLHYGVISPELITVKELAEAD